MNDTERQLRTELDRAASAVRVDVDRLWNAVHERTAGAGPAVHARPWRRRLAPYLAAASVATVLVTVTVGAVIADGNEQPAATTSTPPAKPRTNEPAAGPAAGPIGDWACRHRTLITPGTNSVTGKPIRAVIAPGQAPTEAIEYGVPRYNITVKGQTGVLEYGDAAGRRIARTELTRAGTGWLIGKRTVCSGPAADPSPDPIQLGRHTRSPLPLDPRAAQLTATPIIGTPILVDDRTYYDPAGMLRQRTLYAFQTKGGYQFASMPADDGSYDNRAQPEDLIGGADRVQPTGTDDTRPFAGRERLSLVLSYLTDDKTVEGLTVRSASTGTTGPAQRFDFPGGRTLYTVVSPTTVDGDALVTVHRTTRDDPPRRF
ncbi:hypothetical protein [Kribbella swartbergensis]